MAFFRKEKKDLKGNADSFYTKGQWANALSAYEELISKGKPDVKMVRRVGDLRVKLGNKAGAAEAYRMAADMYAGSGFLVQAIAIYKILLRVDPTAEDVGEKLAGLYAERGLGPTQGEKGAVHGARAPAPSGPQAPAQPMPKIPLFSDLPPEAFGKVVAKLVPHELSGGDYLFREGDPGESIFVVTSGAIEVLRGDHVLVELGEGEFFGEGAYFSHEPRNADVRAAGEGAELLEIRREDLQPLMESYEGVASALNLFYRQRIVDRMLASSPLMSELDSEDRTGIQELFKARRVAGGQDIVTEGEQDRTLYFVIRGQYQVHTRSPGGERLVLGTLGPGEFFGEVAFLSGSTRTATVTAQEDGVLLTITWEALAPHIEKHPAISAALEAARDERAADTVAKILGRGVTGL